MALQSVSATSNASSHEFARALIVAAAIVVLSVIAYALVGVQGAGASLEIAPDPAGLEIPF